MLPGFALSPDSQSSTSPAESSAAAPASQEAPSEVPSHSGSLGLALGLALAILAVNLFLLGPYLVARHGELLANLGFIAVRVGVLVGFAFWAGYAQGRGRWEVIRLGSLLEFFDHVLFKALALYLDFRTNPAPWVGVTAGQVAMGILFSFIVFFPAILILSLVGAELGRAWRARRS
jgi:hypothetical protein